MELPDIEHEVRDEARDNTYVVLAYRQLEGWEIERVVMGFLARTKKIGRGHIYRIQTTIGGRDPLDDEGY